MPRWLTVADGHATYGMMASEGRGWQEVVDNMFMMPREKRMKKVLGVVILALRAADDSTANATDRKAEQWNNLECDYGGELNVNLHVGGDGGASKDVLNEEVTLIAFTEGLPTKRGKRGIMTDAHWHRKAVKAKKGKAVGDTGVWDDYIRYGLGMAAS